MTVESKSPRTEKNALRLWEIEAKIVDVFVEFGKYRNRSPRDSAFITFFYIHKTLTQSELKDLAKRYFNARKLRGFSSGSISTFLNDLERKKVIIKQREEGKNSFQYQILGSLKQVNLSQLGILLFYQSSLEELKRRIEADLVKIEPDSKDFKNIQAFVKELSTLIELYAKIQADLSKVTIIPSVSPAILKKRVEKFFKTIPISTPTLNQTPSTIARIESLIINYFITRDQQTGARGEVTSKVLAHFLIHRELTQERLRQLTGLSMGAVSQAVHTLLEQDIIRTTTTEDRSIHYHLQGLINAFQTFTQILMNKINEFQVELENMFNELEVGKEKFEKNAIYKNLLEFLRDF